MKKLTSIQLGGRTLATTYVGTSDVKEGVKCDVYTFPEDKTRDLGVVRVTTGHSTPLQRVIKGAKTIEGFERGKGTFMLGLEDGTTQLYTFPNDEDIREITVGIGQTMQWTAGDEDLVFYEICEPPYEDGRFENLS